MPRLRKLLFAYLAFVALRPASTASAQADTVTCLGAGGLSQSDTRAINRRLFTAFWLAACVLFCVGLAHLVWPAQADARYHHRRAASSLDDGSATEAIAQRSSLTTALGLTPVTVPAAMRTPPFNVERHLNVPPNFSISVYTRISGARFMAVAPSGDLLVSQPGTGKVLLVRPTGNDDPLIYEFATGLRRPHDIVFHTIGPTTYVYIAETHQINRFIYRPGDTAAHDREIVETVS